MAARLTVRCARCACRLVDGGNFGRRRGAGCGSIAPMDLAKTLRLTVCLSLGWLACAVPFSVAADEKAPPGLATQKVAEGLYLVKGPGGNIALQVGPDAVFLVDDQYAPLTPQLQAEVAKLTAKPVRFVLNTHWHSDHTGGNEALGGAGAVLVAHDNVRRRLSAPQFIELFQRSIPASPAGALPVITFADSLSFHLNGDDIDVFHVEPAHTDGDSIVWFHREDVFHMGDTLVMNGYPFIDLSSGGSIEGYVRAADRVLALAKPTTRIIPGHGDIATPAQLRAWRAMLATIRDRIKKGIAAGKSLAELKASKPSAEFDGEKGNAFIKPDMLIEAIYKDLSKKPSRPQTP
jgi:glyoxylase-like metal-dependent hydrolase (beta-lactamase superfamily II)